jgi:hypothetical protein
MPDGVAAANPEGRAGPTRRTAQRAAMVATMQLISDFPEISQMDLNPVFATKKRATSRRRAHVTD